MLHRLRHRGQRQERHPVGDQGTGQHPGAVEVAQELAKQDRAEDRAGGRRSQDDVGVLRRDADDLAHVGGSERVEIEKDEDSDAHLAEREAQAARRTQSIDTFLQVDEHLVETVAAFLDGRLGVAFEPRYIGCEDESPCDHEQRYASK